VDKKWDDDQTRMDDWDDAYVPRKYSHPESNNEDSSGNNATATGQVGDAASAAATISTSCGQLRFRTGEMVNTALLAAGTALLSGWFLIK
jgi:hypothetical protein